MSCGPKSESPALCRNLARGASVGQRRTAGAGSVLVDPLARRQAPRHRRPCAARLILPAIRLMAICRQIARSTCRSLHPVMHRSSIGAISTKQ